MSLNVSQLLCVEVVWQKKKSSKEPATSCDVAIIGCLHVLMRSSFAFLVTLFGLKLIKVVVFAVVFIVLWLLNQITV